MRMQKKIWFYDVPNQSIPVYFSPLVFRGWRKLSRDYGFTKLTLFCSNKNLFEARFAFLTPDSKKEIRKIAGNFLDKTNQEFLLKNDSRIKIVIRKIDKAVGAERQFVNPYFYIDKLFGLMVELFRFSLISETAVWYLQEYIESFLENRLGQKYNRQFFVDLIAPSSLQYLSKARLSLLKIARAGKDRNIFLERHAKKFFWIKNSYADAYYLDNDYFRKELEKTKKEEAKKEIKKLENYSKNIIAKKKLIFKELGPADKKLLLAIKWIEYLAVWQDLRKEGAAKLVYIFDKLFKRLEHQVGLRVDDLKCLFPEELRKIRNIKPARLKDIIKKRKIAVAFFFDKNKLFVKEGQEALDFEEKIAPLRARGVKELKGLPACAGRGAYGGRTIGQAQVLKSAAEMDRFKKGNILVASNTTPDWLPIMQKAKAILTEKGGITSHAAIVSRELKILCIVGIKNITLIVKEGDRLSIDAREGIVKIM